MRREQYITCHLSDQYEQERRYLHNRAIACVIDTDNIKRVT